MAEVETLLVVLQFLALVAPALAILWRLITESRGVKSYGSVSIGLCFILLILSAWMILVFIWLEFQNIYFRVSILPIFFALFFWLLGILMFVTPLSVWFSKELGPEPTLFQLGKSMLKGLFLGAIGGILLGFSGYLLFLLEDHLNVGLIAATEGLEFWQLYMILSIIVLFRSGVYLLRRGTFFVDDLGLSIKDTMTITLALIIGIFLLGLLPVIAAKILFTDMGIFVQLSADHPVYNIGWFWNVLLILALLAGHLDNEKRDPDEIE